MHIFNQEINIKMMSGFHPVSVEKEAIFQA